MLHMNLIPARFASRVARQGMRLMRERRLRACVYICVCTRVGISVRIYTRRCIRLRLFERVQVHIRVDRKPGVHWRHALRETACDVLVFFVVGLILSSTQAKLYILIEVVQYDACTSHQRAKLPPPHLRHKHAATARALHVDLLICEHVREHVCADAHAMLLASRAGR